MRNFLLKYCSKLLWVVTAIELYLLALLIIKFKKTKNLLYLLAGLVTFGLFYDALILSLGTVIKDDSLLKKLSRIRFISHGALIPLIFPICSEALELDEKKNLFVWAFTAIISILGIAEGKATDLDFKEIADVRRYTAGENTPKWAEGVSNILSFGTVLPLMATGAYQWKQEKTPRLFLSGALMFFFSAIGPATGNTDLLFFISMAGEVLMVLFFDKYADFKEAKKNK